MTPHSSPTHWADLHRLLLPYRKHLLAAVALTGLSRVAALGVPMASRRVVDEVIGAHHTDRLGWITLMVSIAVATEVIAGYAASQVAGVAGQRATARIREELQTRVVGFHLRELEANGSGALVGRIVADSEQVRFLVGPGLVQLMASVITAGLAVVLLLHIDALLTVAVVGLVAGIALWLGRLLGQLSTAYTQVLHRQGELTGSLGQILGAIRVIKAYASERHEAARFAAQSHLLVRDSVAVLKTISLLSSGSAAAAGYVAVILLVIGGRSVAAGDMSLGNLVMYLWLSGFLLAPALHITGSVGEVGKALAAAGRIAELRSLPTEAEEDQRHAAPPVHPGAVDLERVSYAYAPGRLALRDISLNAPAGSTTALIGPNGSGKTTLCRLLIAFDRPTAGRILIDGHDLAAMNRRAYRKRLGVVLQDDVLFDGTIADNIRYGRPRASLSEVQAAAQAAHCDEFVARLPQGYSTPVGERGLRLSAGQRQRVTIARALLVDPRILILDEATSDLDPESEKLIQKALHLLCRGRTTFVIAHRHSTVQDADQILVLDHGRVVDRGTHHELLARRSRHFSPAHLVDLVGGNGREC
ncbi:MAG: ABC transporter ATP-binding protein [Gemmatimonadales bacterium]